jgi:hypothetical protein
MTPFSSEAAACYAAAAAAAAVGAAVGAAIIAAAARWAKVRRRGINTFVFIWCRHPLALLI